ASRRAVSRPVRDSEMEVGDDRIAAPDEDQPAVLELLDVGAYRCADRRGPTCLARRRTDGAIEERRAEAMKEAPIHRRALQQAHRPGIAVRDDRLRTFGRRGDGAEARRDGVERLVPGDALETSFALAADALHRMQEALIGVGTLEIARNF